MAMACANLIARFIPIQTPVVFAPLILVDCYQSTVTAASRPRVGSIASIKANTRWDVKG